MSESEGIRALLVEDDEEDAAIFRRYLSQVTGYDVTIVHVTGEEEALASVATQPFDLAFVDLDFGGSRTGVDLLERLEAAGADVPAVVVTGTGDEEKAVEAMKAGAYDYLVKDDLNTDLLERTVRNVRARCLLEQERARMVEKLAELSITDELTGLANRRQLTRRLEEEVVRSERTGHIFAVVMIDLDHFKLVNDRHGHQSGDQVLRQCADVLRHSLRAADLIGRYGGEEFCAVLPETPAAGARRVAQRLREAVKALPDPVPTISVGVAVWEPGRTAEEILRRADKALYEAKESGRDCVVVYGEDRRRRAAGGP